MRIGTNAARVLIALACLVVAGALVGYRKAYAFVKFCAYRELLALDKAEKRKFEKAHPGALPETSIHMRLPSVSATRFNWCDLNQDFHVHEQKKGSCWANAAVEALECNWLIRNGLRHKFSPQPILDYAQVRENGGADAALALDLLLKHGTAKMYEYPYTGKPGKVKKEVRTRYRAIAWGVVGLNGKITVKMLKAALLRYGPVVVSVDASQDFGKFRKGTPTFNKYKGVLAERVSKGKERGNHWVLLLGWDDKRGRKGAWYIKNSWGSKWGDGGYGWIEYGSNGICYTAYWVKAQSTYYKLPKEEFLKLVPGADPPWGWRSPIENAAITR
jgi:C1A family cysteine protease